MRASIDIVMKKRERKARPLKELLEAARRNRYKVIHERNQILKWAIKASGVAAHIVKRHDAGDWTEILCIHTDAGQLHWRLSPKDAEDFPCLERVKDDHYDGCKSSQKGERLDKLGAA